MRPAARWQPKSPGRHNVIFLAYNLHKPTSSVELSAEAADEFLRRHEFTVVMGGARGLNYASDHRELDGILVPTKRQKV
jgi:hypothetical protein